MKTMKSAIIGAVALSLASAVHSPAIEGLKISTQANNVHMHYGQNGDDLKVYGCWTLTFGAYNGF